MHLTLPRSLLETASVCVVVYPAAKRLSEGPRALVGVQGYKPPEAKESEYQTIPMSKIEDFGVHANQYYSLEVCSPLLCPVSLLAASSDFDSYIIPELLHSMSSCSDRIDTLFTRDTRFADFRYRPSKLSCCAP